MFLLILLLLLLLAVTIFLLIRIKKSPAGSNNTSKVVVGGAGFPVQYRIPNVLPPVDQHSCNACWAIATCQSVSDRYHQKGQLLGDQLNYYAFHDTIVAKTPDRDGCQNGALLNTGMDMLVIEGASLMSATRDRIFDDIALSSDQGMKKYRVKEWRRILGPTQSDTVSLIKKELLSSGPVVAVINLYDSFSDFVGSSPYTPLGGESTDPGMAHMISIIGYDDTDRTWIVRNSYGSTFGSSGYVKIYQGDARMGTEENVYAPDI